MPNKLTNNIIKLKKLNGQNVRLFLQRSTKEGTLCNMKEGILKTDMNNISIEEKNKRYSISLIDTVRVDPENKEIYVLDIKYMKKQGII